MLASPVSPFVALRFVDNYITSNNEYHDVVAAGSGNVNCTTSLNTLCSTMWQLECANGRV